MSKERAEKLLNRAIENKDETQAERLKDLVLAYGGETTTVCFPVKIKRGKREK